MKISYDDDEDDEIWLNFLSQHNCLPVSLGAPAPFDKVRTAMVGGVKLSEANHLTGFKIIYSMHTNFRTLDGICAEATFLTGPDFLTLTLDRARIY